MLMIADFQEHLVDRTMISLTLTGHGSQASLL